MTPNPLNALSKMKTEIIVLKVPDIEQVPRFMWRLALCVFLPT